ncbi:hypothetical protein FCG67_09060 [Rhodococcus oryzae]|uniref:Lipoprotein n=1 Tax=Rhodococcus oryzae TaxID=2571143 RepID=A0ABY2RMY3_9NOCA|nr:hypothetical protein FCG67_09060 [Rhodococcus oryzae]
MHPRRRPNRPTSESTNQPGGKPTCTPPTYPRRSQSSPPSPTPATSPAAHNSAPTTLNTSRSWANATATSPRSSDHPYPRPVQTRRILELTLGAAALIAVVAAVVVSIGSTPETAQADSVDDTLTVTGNVSYRERIAFPENAVVTVRLEDISLADAPATLLAEQRIEDATGVPVPFELAAYRDAIDPRARLAIRAQIEVDGALRWTTDTVHPIPVEGDVQAQELILVAVPQ